MSRTRRILGPLCGLALLMGVPGYAQAYICSGLGNDLQDANCSATQIAGLYGLTAEQLVLGAKDNVDSDDDIGNLVVTDTWSGYGSLADRTVKFTYEGGTPLFVVEKFDGMYSVYDWDTQVNVLGGGYYSFVRELMSNLVFFDGSTFDCGSEPGGQPNCSAGTSHVSAYVPLPGAVWLLGSALVGLVAIGRRRRRIAA